MSSNQAQTLVFVGFIYVIGCLDTNKLFSNVAGRYSSVLFIILRQMLCLLMTGSIVARIIFLDDLENSQSISIRNRNLHLFVCLALR